MDYVFFIIKKHEVYVGEYYKNEVKQVKFKDKDFWEVFDQHDFIEMLEYMHYPMNYNHFKDNKIRILYDDPAKYEILYACIKAFGQAISIEVGQLEPYLKKCYLEQVKFKGECENAYAVYEQTCYQVLKETITLSTDEGLSAETIQHHMRFDGLEMDVSEIQEAVEAAKIEYLTTEMVCKCLLEDESMVVELAAHYPILAPVNLKQDKEGNNAQKKFLETHYSINLQSMANNEALITKEEAVFEYTKIVHKLFGSKDIQKLQKHSLLEGKYFMCYQGVDDALWARKGQLIGVVGNQQESQKSIEEWIQKAGY